MDIFVDFFQNISIYRNPVTLAQEVIIRSLESNNDTVTSPLIQDVNYIKVWELEKSLDLNSWMAWFHQNSFISVYISMAYLLSVFLGQHIMKDRKPFILREHLVIWNIALGIFSGLGFIRTAPELFYILKQDNGFHLSVCTRDYHNMATAFWWLLITLSKVAELGDTVFSILRKKPVTFLAWSHHSLALISSFIVYSSQSSITRWFLVMNYFVHSIMYPYFAARTLGYKLPKIVPMAVTFFQLSQMIIAFTATLYGLYAKNALLMECAIPSWQLYLTPIMYGYFVFLFGDLFYTLYIKKKPSKKID